MSDHDMLVFYIGVTAFCTIVGLSFVVWLLWSLLWDWFDDHMQNRLRIKNRQIDPSYTTGQFSVPYGQRDWK